MTGQELLEFIKSNTGWQSPPEEEGAIRAYFDETVNKKLYIPKYHNGKLIGVLTYYRVADLTQAIIFDNVADLPPNPLVGPYVYVSFICVAPSYRRLGVVNELIEKLKNIKPLPKAGYWVSPEGEWKVIERGGDMKSNCGIVAFDQIAGHLTGRSNVISLSTLSRIAQDNEFLLYPLKVKRADLLDIPKPYILHNDFHFQTIKSDEDLIAFNLPEEVYVLSSSPIGGEVVDDDEARKVRGAKKFFKQIFAPYVAPVIASLIPGIGPLASAALTAGTAAGGSMINASTAPGKQSFGDLAKAGAIGAGTSLLGSAVGGAALKGIGSALGGTALGNGLSSLGGQVGKAASGVGQLAKGALGSLKGIVGGGASGAAGSAGNALLAPAGMSLANSAARAALPAGASNISWAAKPIASAASQAVLGPAVKEAGGGLLSKLGGEGALGALSLGAGLLKSATAKNPYEGIEDNISSLVGQAQARAQGTGLSPLGNAAQTELLRGIASGRGAVLDLTKDEFFQSAFRAKMQDNEKRKQEFINNQALYGRVNSGETQAQLAQFDRQLAQEMDDFRARYEEDARRQAIDSMNKYLELASQGDVGAFEQLRNIIGDEYNAQLALKAWQDGKQASMANTLTNLGGSLLLNKFLPTSGR